MILLVEILKYTSSAVDFNACSEKLRVCFSMPASTFACFILIIVLIQIAINICTILFHFGMTYVSSARHVWAFFKRGICTLSRAMDNISKFVAGCISMSVSVTFLNRNHKQMKISRLNVAYNIDTHTVLKCCQPL